MRRCSSVTRPANTFPVCNTSPGRARGSYLPGRLEAARQPVVALFPRKVHRLDGGQTPGTQHPESASSPEDGTDRVG